VTINDENVSYCDPIPKQAQWRRHFSNFNPKELDLVMLFYLTMIYSFIYLYLLAFLPALRAGKCNT